VNVDLDSLLQKAAELARGDRFAEALDACSAAISKYPEQPEGYAKRAYVNAREGDYEKAIADIDTAIKLSPAEIEYWYARGRYATSLGDYSRAASDFARVLDLSESHGNSYYVEPAHFFHAYALIYLGRIEEALQALENVNDSFETWVNERVSKSDLKTRCTRSNQLSPGP